MALDRRIDHPSRTTLLLLLLAACTPSPDNADAAGATRASEPAVVCQHLRTLAAKDNTEEQVLDQVQRQCVQSLEGLQSRYETFANCVEAAATSAAVVQCEAALTKPPSLLAAASPTAQLEVVCDRVISLLTAEIPDMRTIDAEQVATLRQRCIDDAGKKLEANGVEAFAKQSECILAATNLQTLQACGSF
jgi:hypothetical protein